MTSRKNQEMMKERLIRERDSLLREKVALENKILGLELAISLIDVVDDESEALQANGKRVATKSVVLDLLFEVGLTGLNANNAVDLASRRGITLDKSSVSSLLSRLKKEETVDYDGEKYRLKQFAKSVVSEAPEEKTSLGFLIKRPPSPPMPPHWAVKKVS